MSGGREAIGPLWRACWTTKSSRPCWSTSWHLIQQHMEISKLCKYDISLTLPGSNGMQDPFLRPNQDLFLSKPIANRSLPSSNKVIAPITTNCQKMGKFCGENMFYIHFSMFYCVFCYSKVKTLCVWSDWTFQCQLIKMSVLDRPVSFNAMTVDFSLWESPATLSETHGTEAIQMHSKDPWIKAKPCNSEQLSG